MEVTPLVVMPPRVSSGRNPSIVSPPSRLQSSYPVFHPLGSRNKSPYLHPSLYYQQDEVKFRQQQLQQQHRIFFSALSLANLFSRTTVTFTTFTTGKPENDAIWNFFIEPFDLFELQKRKLKCQRPAPVFSSSAAHRIRSPSPFAQPNAECY